MDKDQEGDQSCSCNFVFLFSGLMLPINLKRQREEGGKMVRGTISLHSKDPILLFLFAPLILAPTPKSTTPSPPSTYAMLGRQAFLNMCFKHKTYCEFSWPVNEESEDQSSETTRQFIEWNTWRNTWAVGHILLEVSLKYGSLSGIFREALSAFSEGRAILLPVISRHFIYPSAQHLSEDIVTRSLFLFPVRSRDPLWQTLSMHPLGPEQHLACCRCQTRVCSGNDRGHAVQLAAIFILVLWVLFAMDPVG